MFKKEYGVFSINKAGDYIGWYWFKTSNQARRPSTRCDNMVAGNSLDQARALLKASRVTAKEWWPTDHHKFFIRRLSERSAFPAIRADRVCGMTAKRFQEHYGKGHPFWYFGQSALDKIIERYRREKGRGAVSFEHWYEPEEV